MAMRTVLEQFQSWCISTGHRRALTPGSRRDSFRVSGLIAILLLIAMTCLQVAGERKPGNGQRFNSPEATVYRVLEPITSGNLTIFPVTAETSHETAGFITLDEGVRAGTVVVTEQGQMTGMIRPGSARPVRGGAEVNRLALYNKSGRPLLLLAGEIVTGGKQDRVIAADRIVPFGPEAVDLGVFCVEPGRWVGSSNNFGSMKSQMAQPSVRRPAMAAKSQAMVWDQVREKAGRMSASVPMAPAASGTTSYARVMADEAVQETVDKVAAPITQDYEALLRHLKQTKAVGVVVAVNGEVLWADIFSSPGLLEKYWPKLVRSYAAEAVTSGSGKVAYPMVSAKSAQQFVDELGGDKEVVETDAGVFRRSDVSGDGYRVFTLTSLLPKMNFEVHITKMKDRGEMRGDMKERLDVRPLQRFRIE
jgi:hypothetical protein